MSFMEWSGEYELGIPEMDRQHMRWLELLNAFYDHLSTGDFNQRLKKLVDEAYVYTQYHFSEEERLMSTIGYPAVEDQREMHRRIAEKILDFKQRIDAGQHVVSVTLTSELKSWFTQHIKVEDKKYAAMYLEKRKSA